MPPKKNFDFTVGALCGVSKLPRASVEAVLVGLRDIAVLQVAQTGQFVLPGMVTIKTLSKKATPERDMKMFGKVVRVKAKPAKTVLKAHIAKDFQDKFTHC